jgi:hypothetical protein
MTDDSSIYKTHTRTCVYVFKKTTVILSSVIPLTQEREKRKTHEKDGTVTSVMVAKWSRECLVNEW